MPAWPHAASRGVRRATLRDLGPLPPCAGLAYGSVALVDGNKRLSWLVVVVFLDFNRLPLDAPDDDAYDLVIAVSTGALDYTAAALRLKGWNEPIAGA